MNWESSACDSARRIRDHAVDAIGIFRISYFNYAPHKRFAIDWLKVAIVCDQSDGSGLGARPSKTGEND